MRNRHLHLKKALRAALFVLLLSVVGTTKMYASYDFSAVCETGQTLYYNITDAENHYVELTYPGSYSGSWTGFTMPTGDVILPESVQYDGVTYSVTSIGYRAFSVCLSLTTIEIPNSVTSIGDYAFYDCYLLASIEIPNSVTSIGDYAFYQCTGLTFVEIPNSVTSIGDYVFHNCHLLTFVEIPNSVTSIGDYAFSSCSGLTSIEIPNSVTSISEGAFSDCWSLTTIEIPNSVTSISVGAFNGCSGLEQIIVDSGNTVYDSRENCNAIINTETNEMILGCKNAIIPNTVTSIGFGAFFGCSGLTTIEIPNSVTSIGKVAFHSCSGLTSIEIPNSVASIDLGAFFGCSGLTSIEIPNSVTSIGYEMFSHCNSLTSIEIPNSVISIGDLAFSWCSGLTSMTVLADNPPTVGYDAFYDVNKEIPMYVPCGSMEAYQNANGWNEFINIQEVVCPQQTIELTHGWNWWSASLDITLDDLKAALVAALPGTNIAIKSKDGSTIYNGTRWRGQLSTLDVTQMYKIGVSADCEITLEGKPLNPVNYPITISYGSNYIGFPSYESMSIRKAFGRFPVAGDVVKSKSNGSSRFDGTRWKGSLKGLEPGQGYIYISTVQGDRTLTFPRSAK